MSFSVCWRWQTASKIHGCISTNLDHEIGSAKEDLRSLSVDTRQAAAILRLLFKRFIETISLFLGKSAILFGPINFL